MERCPPVLTPALRAVVDEILKADRRAPRKQRHTARRIFGRLKTEHHYVGAESTVRKYVGQQRRELIEPEDPSVLSTVLSQRRFAPVRTPENASGFLRNARPASLGTRVRHHRNTQEGRWRLVRRRSSALRRMTGASSCANRIGPGARRPPGMPL